MRTCRNSSTAPSATFRIGHPKYGPVMRSSKARQARQLSAGQTLLADKLGTAERWAIRGSRIFAARNPDILQVDLRRQGDRISLDESTVTVRQVWQIAEQVVSDPEDYEYRSGMGWQRHRSRTRLERQPTWVALASPVTCALRQWVGSLIFVPNGVALDERITPLFGEITSRNAYDGADHDLRQFVPVEDGKMDRFRSLATDTRDAILLCQFWLAYAQGQRNLTAFRLPSRHIQGMTYANGSLPSAGEVVSFIGRFKTIPWPALDKKHASATVAQTP